MPGIVHRAKSFTALLIMVTALAVAAIPQTVSAAPGNPGYCYPQTPRLTNANIGTEVPVILVHGASGNAQQWGTLNDTTTLAGKINNLPDVAVGHIFDHGTFDFDSGTRLARTIDCLAQLSTANGGKGKVIVVGYSQGGLIARYALSNNLPRNVRDQVGQVVTLGTPHDAPTVPAFQGPAIIHTVAANIINTYKNPQGQVIRTRPTNTDGTIGVSSATIGYTNDDNEPRGGGSTVITCPRYYTVYAGIFTIPDNNVITCEHPRLVSGKSSGAHKATTDAITEYVTWLNKPAAIKLTVGSLTTSYNSDWKNADYGASGPGYDATADDKTNAVDCTNCGDTTPVPKSYPFIYVAKMEWCDNSNLLSCVVGSSPIIGPAPAVSVGGRTPDSSARYEESGGYDGTALAWCFTAEKICITYRRGADTPQLEVSAALLHVFETATWAD